MPDTPYQKTAIYNINLTINHGEFVAIIGHTGSGKSTLVQHMNGLLTPTSGEVRVDGANINEKKIEAKVAKQKVGMVFQYPEHQLFEETIYEDIAFGPKNLGVKPERMEERVKKAMRFVGLDYEEFKDRSPFQLSGGQMRRVAIAGIVALEPEYLILDEPSAGLDPRGRDEIFGQVIRLYKDMGITVILVSHNMEDVAKMAKRVIVMNHGQISLDGSVEEIFLNGGEALLKAGVDAPPVVRLMDKINQSGLSVDTGALTPKGAAENILAALKAVGRC
jgi:energy-coupling factor transport system ATP-binding protein